MAIFETDPLAANLVILGIALLGTAAYVLLRYVLKRSIEGLDKEFGYFMLLIGLYTALYGLFYSMLWPAPMGGAYGILFGDSYAILGFLELFASFTMLKGGSFFMLAIFAFFAGIYAIVSGWGGYVQSMTKSPIEMFGLYFSSGMAGVLVGPTVLLRNNTAGRIIGILLIIALVVAAVLAMITGYGAIGGHLVDFSSYHGL